MSSGKTNVEGGPKALLNQEERRMLRGEKIEGLTDEARWQRHSRIRKRLQWTIYDFALVYDNWDELNLDKSFKDDFNPYLAQDGASRAISTLYRGLSDSQLTFENVLIDGVYRAEVDLNNRRVNPRFEVHVRVPGDVYVNRASERVNPEDVDSMRIPEMRAVLEALAHSDADIPKLVEKGRQSMLFDGDEED